MLVASSISRRYSAAKRARLSCNYFVQLGPIAQTSAFSWTKDDAGHADESSSSESRFNERQPVSQAA